MAGAPGLSAPAGVQFVPGEGVLLLAVTLPKMSAARRRATVGFAVEDQIARPLDEVHVALGPQLADGRWLVGVVARDALPAPAKPGLRLLPDTLALPIPAEGAWSAYETDGRILIRLPDGTGFVTGPQGLTVLHQIASAPEVVLYAGQIECAHMRASLPQVVLPAPFDLSHRSPGSRMLPPLARRLIAIAACAALGHLAVLAVDTISLQRRQAALEAELRAAAKAGPEMGIDALLARILAPAPQVAPKGFLDLISATFAAAAPQAGAVSVRELRYGFAQNSLTLTLQASDLGTLQQLETGLSEAGLAVSSGPATSAGGTAEQQLTLKGPPT